ncbi:hypothetical protein BHE74_00016735 [Ensete ventricosum]|nr:hypothetical protein BHE74_00016735 [Ensete ventricosum]
MVRRDRRHQNELSLVVLFFPPFRPRIRFLLPDRAYSGVGHRRPADMAEERYNRRNPAVKRILQETKICLSISNYHPEHWQPSWSAPPVPQLPPTPTTEPTDIVVNEEQVNAGSDAITATEDLPTQEVEQGAMEDGHEVRGNAVTGPPRVGLSAGVSLSMTPAAEVGEQPQRPAARAQNSLDDRVLTWAAIWLVVAILLLLAKKFLKSNAYAGYMSGSK